MSRQVNCGAARQSVVFEPQRRIFEEGFERVRMLHGLSEKFVRIFGMFIHDTQGGFEGFVANLRTAPGCLKRGLLRPGAAATEQQKNDTHYELVLLWHAHAARARNGRSAGPLRRCSTRSAR